MTSERNRDIIYLRGPSMVTRRREIHMARGEPKNRRDFGGLGKEDWFTLHESIDPHEGLTPSQAKDLADFLRIVGNAAKMDPLGGNGRMGVYYRKAKGRQSIRIGTIPRAEFREWFHKRTGTERGRFSESTVSNFIAQNPHLVCGHDCRDIHVWREQVIGNRPVDVIIETEKDLWVIEVKDTSKFVGALGPLRKAVKAVREYGNTIRELGWWKYKTMMLAIVWGTHDDVPSYSKKFYRSHELPFDLSEDTANH